MKSKAKKGLDSSGGVGTNSSLHTRQDGFRRFPSSSPSGSPALPRRNESALMTKVNQINRSKAKAAATNAILIPSQVRTFALMLKSSFIRFCLKHTRIRVFDTSAVFFENESMEVFDKVEQKSVIFRLKAGTSESDDLHDVFFYRNALRLQLSFGMTEFKSSAGARVSVQLDSIEVKASSLMKDQGRIWTLKSVFFDCVLKNLVIDYALDGDSKTMVPFVSLPSFEFQVEFEASNEENLEFKGSANLQLAIDSFKMIIDESLIFRVLSFLEESKRSSPEAYFATQSVDSNQKLQQAFGEFANFQVSVTAKVINPQFLVRLVHHNSSGKMKGYMFVFGFDQFIFASVPVPDEDRASRRMSLHKLNADRNPFHSTSSKKSFLVRMEQEMELVAVYFDVIAASSLLSLGETAYLSEKERLFLLDSLVGQGNLILNMTPNGVLMVRSDVDWNMETAVCDGSRFTSSENIDFLHVADALVNFKQKLALFDLKMNPEPQSSLKLPTASSPLRTPHESSFVVDVRFSLSLVKFLVVLLAETRKHGIAFSVEGLDVDFARSSSLQSVKVDLDLIMIESFVKEADIDCLDAFFMDEIQIERETILQVTQIGAHDSGDLPEDVLTSLTVQNMMINYNIRIIYVCFLSAAYLIKLGEAMGAKAGSSKKKSSSRKQKIKYIPVKFNAVDVHCELPEDVSLDLRFTPVHVELASEGSVILESESVKFTSSCCASDDSAEIASINKFSLMKVKDSNANIDLSAQEVSVFIPHNFILANLIENFVNSIKTIKIFKQKFIVGSGTKANGERYRQTFAKDIKAPIISVKIESFSFDIEDDPFEARLLLNMKEGSDEQRARISRLAAFEKKVEEMLNSSPRRSPAEKTEMNISEIQRALYSLLEHNSSSWVEIVKKRPSQQPRKVAYIMQSRIQKLSILISPPDLEGLAVEEFLHTIDMSTPSDYKYDDLIPRNVVLKFDGLKITLKDTPTPMLNIPPSDVAGIESFSMAGTLVIAEQIAHRESYRKCALPLQPAESVPVIVRRTVNPVKLYTKMQFTIHSRNTIVYNYGVSVEPYLCDLTRIIDTFTKPNVDPSPAIGWWDKMRVIVHGKNTLKIGGGGELRIRIVGSTSPYFDHRRHFGLQGAEFVFAKGTEIKFGFQESEAQDPFLYNIFINTGQLLLVAPLHSKSEAKKDEVFVNLFGGVQAVVSIRFVPEETQKARLHHEIVLKDPKYVARRADTGLRSRDVLVTIDIKSPKEFYWHLSEPSNCIVISKYVLDVFRVLIPMYQSPVTTVPIRRGVIFKNEEELSKPKLSKLIRSLHLRADVYPLVSSYIQEIEAGISGVGLRIKAENMKLEMIFEQHLFKLRQRADLPDLQRKATKWSLEASEIEFSELEARAVSYTGAVVTREGALDDDEEDWFTLADEIHGLKSRLEMIPFAWTPKFVYYKRVENAETKSKLSSRHSTAISEIELNLMRERVLEIEETIHQLHSLQEQLAEKYQKMPSESVRKQITGIVSKVESLCNRKLLVESQIRTRQNSSMGRYQRVETDQNISNQMFDHNYVIYNIKLLWKKDVRNTIFRLIGLHNMNSTIRYFLKNAASNSLRDFVQGIEKLRMGEMTPGQTPVGADASSDAEAPPAASSTEFGSKAAQDLLNMLLADIDNFYVKNEMDSQPKQVDLPQIAAKRCATTARKMFNFGNQVYIPSADPQSPDYIPESHSFNSSYIIEFVLPQVNFEACLEGNKDFLQSMVVSSEIMTWMSIDILDDVKEKMDMLHSSEYIEHIVKYRSIWTIDEAQFFVANKYDIETSLEADNVSAIQYKWPLWLPVEVLLDSSLDPEFLHPIVNRTCASMHKETYNTLYSRKVESGQNEEKTTSIHFNFPELVISITSLQCAIINNIIMGLLVYSDPADTVRAERRKKMILALEQNEDFRTVTDWVFSLQEKIRQTQTLILYSHEILEARVCKELRDLDVLLRKYQEELYVVMSSIRELQTMNTRKNSVESEWHLQVHMERLIWLMVLNETTTPFAQGTLNELNFYWSQKMDSSSFNTLEINQLLVKPLTKAPLFSDIITPYSPDDKEIDFNRQKMLRIYWRELPAVAGIQVVDHFEVNFFPLRLQLTYDIAKMLMQYIFPERKSKDDESTQLSVRSVKALAENSGDLSMSMKAKLSSNKLEKKKNLFNQLKEMQDRAIQNRSFIYIKVPGVQHCLSYRGSKEKNFEDINSFVFKMPMLEYRNKTWTWFDFLQQVKRDAVRAIIMANTASLVREKLFNIGGSSRSDEFRKKGEPSASSEEKEDDSVSVFVKSDAISITSTTKTGKMAKLKGLLKSVRQSKENQMHPRDSDNAQNDD